MRTGWKTHAIGRHLVDVPRDAKLIESYKFNNETIEPLLSITNKSVFDVAVGQREENLRLAKHNTRGSMFVERVKHPNGSVTLVSWNKPTWEKMYWFDTYFWTGSKAIKYSADVDLDRKNNALDLDRRFSEILKDVPFGDIPQRIGFVANNVIFSDNVFNLESWKLSVKLANEPDVFLDLSAFTQRIVEESLRKRAGGALAGLLSGIQGLSQLRNRERSVGPIWGEEILTAGTDKGKRLYAFKWEAPGKAHSLAEPNINVELGVIESNYETNKESFANDEEALQLWDDIVGSIRLRPGAV